MSYIPVQQREIKKKEDLGVSLLDIIPSVEKTSLTTPAVVKEKPYFDIENIAKLVKTIQEEITRSGASVALSAIANGTSFIAPMVSKITGESVESIRKRAESYKEMDISENKVAQLLFGKRPLEAIETRIAKTEKQISQEGLPIIGRPEWAEGLITGKEKYWATIGVLGTITLDFTGWSGGKKRLVKFLAKTNKVDDVSKALKAINVADDLIAEYAPRIAKMNKADDVVKAINKLEELQKTIKTAPKLIPKELEPLAKEARKYKSAEEFAKNKLKEVQIKKPLSKFYATDENIAYRITRERPKGDVIMPEGSFVHRGEIKGIEGHWFSTDRGETEMFATKPNTTIRSIDISGKRFAPAEKYFPKDLETYDEKMIGTIDNLKLKKSIERAVKDGYDGIFDRNSGYFFLPTKSQLINFYNQAVRRVKEVKLTIPVRKARERKFLTSTRKAVPPIKISGQYIPRETDELAIKAKNLIKEDIETAEKLALTGTDDKAVATAAELIKHYSDLAKKTTTKAEKNVYYDKIANISVEIAPKLTEQGRAIQAASILGRQTPEGQVRFAARVIQKYNEAVEATRGGILGLRKKVPELTKEQAEDILTKAKKIQEMPDGTNKAIAFKKLQDEIADLVPSPWYKKAINLWKAGLLTGLKTTGVNTLSNLFHGVSEIVKDIPAAGVDSIASLFTKERKLAFTLRGLKGGGEEGLYKGWRYMKTGFDERNVGTKLDWRRVSFGKSKFAKAIQKYEEGVFHWIGAQDQPFYYGAKARSIVSQAIAEGKNRGLKGIKLRNFVRKLIENPTDDMIRYATNDAEIAVFQNRTILGDVARGIQKIPGGEIVVPFGRTPSAVIMQVFNYSPAGIVKTIVQNIGKGRFDQRLFAQGIGRGITGTAAFYIGMKLAEAGLVALDYPISEREQNQWKLEGKRPNAIKTADGRWRSVLPLGPLGMTILFGAHFQNAIKDKGSFSAGLSEAVLATSKSFSEQTFLTGVNQFVSALNDPGRYAYNVTSRTFSSVVPTLVSDIARSIDPLERRDYAKTEGFFASFKARIPFIRETLEPKLDVFGSPLARSGNAIETMIDPTRPTRIKSTKVVEELKRLANNGYLATPTRFADEKKYSDVLTPQQITYLQEKAGVVLEGKLEKLLDHPKYKEADDAGKKRLIQKFTERARLDARAEMVEELVRDMDSKETRAKLRELKESGFLTEEVFKRWYDLFR